MAVQMRAQSERGLAAQTTSRETSSKREVEASKVRRYATNNPEGKVEENVLGTGNARMSSAAHWERSGSQWGLSLDHAWRMNRQGRETRERVGAVNRRANRKTPSSSC